MPATLTHRAEVEATEAHYEYAARKRGWNKSGETWVRDLGYGDRQVVESARDACEGDHTAPAPMAIEQLWFSEKNDRHQLVRLPRNPTMAATTRYLKPGEAEEWLRKHGGAS